MVETLPQLTVKEQVIKWEKFIWLLARKYADRYSANRVDDVDDMYGTIVAAALKYGSNHDPAKGSFSTWLGWIARSQFLKQRLQRLKTQPTMSICMQGKVSEDQDWSGTFPDLNAVDVRDELDKKLRTEAIDEAIEQLPADEREVVRKHFWSDDDKERSATRPSWAEAQSLISALKKLRPLLERFRDDDEHIAGEAQARQHEPAA